MSFFCLRGRNNLNGWVNRQMTEPKNPLVVGTSAYLVDPSAVSTRSRRKLAERAALSPRNVSRTKLPVCETCCIERDISIKCEKRADAEKYSEYLIHYPFRRMRGRENEGVRQRFDSAECEDYHHTFPHLFLHLLSPVG